MNKSLYAALTLILILAKLHANGAFNPDRTDYNAYGVKIAMNEDFLVLAQNKNDPPTFLIQFAPYNDTQTPLQCTTSHVNLTNSFIYTVVAGKSQPKNHTQFYFAGEFTNNHSAIIVGTVIYTRTNATKSSNGNSSLRCSTSFAYHYQLISNYGHQEYLILGVEPSGRYVYGFSNEFIFLFDSRNTSRIDIWNASITWPDTSFIPHAVDIHQSFGVISGFINEGRNSTVKYSPMIYLINYNQSNNCPIVVNQYKPVATPGTWQDLLTNADANYYSAKYDMSVSINDYGDVLVGMQFINRVFLFSVNLTKSTKLNFVSRHTNGRTLGNGKSIAWLQNGIAALIVNIYTLDYVWTTSQVHIYDIQSSGYNSNSTPLSVFPNNHQKLPSTIDPVFLNIVSSPSSLALLDNRGRIIIFLPTLPGFYLTIQDTGTMPLVTTAQPCLPGTYKNQSGIHDCTLCPAGTRNPGNVSTFCIPCSPNTFCPLASANEVSQTALQTVNQAIPYPKSPESVIFDEILIQNMFSIGSGRCLQISPLFWTLVVAGLAVLVILIMGILKFFTKDPRGERVRSLLKCIFRHTDLIGEGELWVGGLASFSVIVLVIFACIFSQNYVKQYPIETSSDSHFACDLSIRNAKFETSVQSLAIPLTDADQKMFDLLNNQEFILKVDFVNTIIKCDAVSIEVLFGITWSTIRWLNCDNINYTLTLSIPLPYQHISVQIYIADVRTIGAIRVGLFGQEQSSENYALKQLKFYQPFHKNGNILARNLPIALALTKVINETLAIDGGDPIFSGIYIPTFTVDYNSLFFTEDQFIRSTLTLTTLTLVITETPYYVKNLQQPIAKPSEIVFQNLLFITVCLELFGLIFLSYKLLFKPFYLNVLKKYRDGRQHESVEKQNLNEHIISFDEIQSISF
ncbi:unnamed protein product [Adineta ricciae]|uniref:Transmembrane protein n=1 Tax=Adineta ricciae TaxID=249248 RepID=A0A814QBM4_ADIRI|nr:unnamed protein product [Adineta ricciae]CAF1362763.1 unnamed protein product [Adineta ricciae]